jgi:HEAT repeat protein
VTTTTRRYRCSILVCVFALASAVVMAASAMMANADENEKPTNPRRRLSDAECREIATLSAILINKQEEPFERVEAARKLGRTGAHIYSLPALLAVLRDSKDVPEVRNYAAHSITYVRDLSVIDEMIEVSTDRDHNVAYDTNVQLFNLTRGKIGSMELVDRDPTSAKRIAIHEKWKTWWKENRATAVLDWDNKGMP